MGGGAAWFDYDMDQDEDLFIIGGVNRDMLYRNDGGTFTEVGLSAGLTTNYPTFGVVTGDIDNDGFREIFVTTDVGYPNLLYFNNASV